MGTSALEVKKADMWSRPITSIQCPD